MIKKIFYLGPQGSYTDLAVTNFKKYLTQDCVIEAVDSIHKIVHMLEDFDAENIGAVVPIENSIEGVVRETQDNLPLLAQKEIRILAESKMKIEHCLVGFGDKKSVKTITSHPQALAQCQEYIYKNWGDNVEQKPVLSTSSAVSTLKSNAPEVTAIANEYCAKLYGVPVIEHSINDEDNNETRFVLLSKFKPKKCDLNKVSIIFSTENESGALNRVLSVLEKYELNMSYINSRPSRKELGEYVFYVDFSGHIIDNNVLLALAEIQQTVKMFKVLSEGAEMS